MANQKKIDPLDTDVVFAFVAAAIGDVTFLFILTHYICGVFVLGAFWRRSKGFLAKTMLVLGFILPLPLLSISVLLSITLSNRALAIIAEQAGIQLIALASGGFGEVLEIGAVGAEATEAGVAAAEIGAEAAEAAEGAAAAGEAASTAAEAGTGAAETTGEAGGEAAQESKTIGERAEEKLREKGEEKLREKMLGDEDEDDEETENIRPSERRTEHGTRQGEQVIPEEESEEERKKREADEAYEEMMKTDSERDPLKLAKDELFSEKGPQRTPPKVVDIEAGRSRAQAKKNPTPQQPETVAERYLRERFKRRQPNEDEDEEDLRRAA